MSCALGSIKSGGSVGANIGVDLSKWPASVDPDEEGSLADPGFGFVGLWCRGKGDVFGDRGGFVAVSLVDVTDVVVVDDDVDVVNDGSPARSDFLERQTI